jgi:hypothetical protein
LVVEGGEDAFAGGHGLVNSSHAGRGGARGGAKRCALRARGRGRGIWDIVGGIWDMGDRIWEMGDGISQIVDRRWDIGGRTGPADLADSTDGSDAGGERWANWRGVGTVGDMARGQLFLPTIFLP